MPGEPGGERRRSSGPALLNGCCRSTAAIRHTGVWLRKEANDENEYGFEDVTKSSPDEKALMKVFSKLLEEVRLDVEGESEDCLPFIDAIKADKSVMQLDVSADKAIWSVTYKDQILSRCAFSGNTSNFEEWRQSLEDGIHDWNKAIQIFRWKFEVFDISVKSDIFTMLLDTHFFKLRPFYTAPSNSQESDAADDLEQEMHSMFKQNNLIITYSPSERNLLVEAECLKDSDENPTDGLGNILVDHPDDRRTLSCEINTSQSIDTFFSKDKSWDSKLVEHDSVISVFGVSHNSGVFQVIEQDLLKGIHVVDSQMPNKEDRTLDDCLMLNGGRKELNFIFKRNLRTMGMVARYFYGNQEIISCEFQFRTDELKRIGQQFQACSDDAGSASGHERERSFTQNVFKNALAKRNSLQRGHMKKSSQDLSFKSLLFSKHPDRQFHHDKTQDILEKMRWQLLVSSFGTVRLLLLELIEESCQLQSTEETIFAGSRPIKDEINDCDQILEFKNRWRKGNLAQKETDLVVICTRRDDGAPTHFKNSLKEIVSETSKTLMKFVVSKGLNANVFQRENFEDKVLKHGWKLKVRDVTANSPLFQATLEKTLAGLGARIFYDETGNVRTRMPSVMNKEIERSWMKILLVEKAAQKFSRKRTLKKSNSKLEEILTNQTEDILTVMKEGKLSQNVEFYRTVKHGLTMKAKAFIKTSNGEEQDLISCLFGFNTEANSWKDSVLFHMNISGLTANSKVMKSVNKYLADFYLVAEGDPPEKKLLDEIRRSKFQHNVELERLNEDSEEMCLKISYFLQHDQYEGKRRKSFSFLPFENQKIDSPAHSKYKQDVESGDIVSCMFHIPSLFILEENNVKNLEADFLDDKQIMALKIANLSSYKSMVFQNLDNFLLALDADVSFDYLKQLWSELNPDEEEVVQGNWAPYSQLVGVDDQIKLESALCNEKLLERKVELTRTDSGITLKAVYCLRKNRYLDNVPDIEVASCVFENLSGFTKKQLRTHNLLEQLSELRISPKFVSLKKVAGGTLRIEECAWRFGKTFFQKRQKDLLKILESGEKTNDLIHVLENMVLHSTHPVHLAVGIACSAKKHSYQFGTREHTLVEICKHFSTMALKFINNSPLYEDDKAVLDLVRGGLTHGHILSEASNYELKEFIASGKIQAALSSVLFGIEEIQRLTTKTRMEKFFQRQDSKTLNGNQSPPHHSRRFSRRESFLKHMRSGSGSQTIETESKQGLSLFKAKMAEFFHEVTAVRPKYTMYRKSPFMFSFIEFGSHLLLFWITIRYIWDKPLWSEIMGTTNMKTQFGAMWLFIIGGIFHEVGQAMNLKSRYISVWNVLDNGSYLCCVVWVWMLFENEYGEGEDGLKAYRVLAINGILVLFKILRFLSLSAMFGPLVMIIMNMVTEILTFMVIFAMVIWGFAATMHSLYWDMEEYRTVSKSILTLIEVSMGEINFAVFDNLSFDRSVWGAVLLTLYLIIGTVILLNLLIAILSNTYDKIQRDCKGQWSVMRAKFILQRFVNAKTSDNRVPNALILLPPPFNVVLIPGQLLMWGLYWKKKCRQNSYGRLFFWRHRSKTVRFMDDQDEFEESSITKKLEKQKKRFEALQDSYAEYHQIMYRFEKEYADLVGKHGVEQEHTLFAMLSSTDHGGNENEYWKAIGKNSYLNFLYWILWTVPLLSVDLGIFVMFQLPPYLLQQTLVWCSLIPISFWYYCSTVWDAARHKLCNWLYHPSCFMRRATEFGILLMVPFAVTVYIVAVAAVLVFLLASYPPWTVYLALKDYFWDYDANDFKDLIDVDDREFHYVLPYITNVNLGVGFLSKDTKVKEGKQKKESQSQIQGQLAKLESEFSSWKNEFTEFKNVVLANLKQK